MAPVAATNSNNSIRSTSGVAPSNIAAANLAASLAAGAQQKIFLNLPTGGKLQVVQQPAIFQLKQEPCTE